MSDLFEFPNLPVSKQLFFVPGAANQSAITMGGTQVFSPEPGGFARLKMEFTMSVTQWEDPSAGWLASKTNGEVFRVKLAETPQVLGDKTVGQTKEEGYGLTWDNGALWDDDNNGGLLWEADGYSFHEITTTTVALVGSNSVSISLPKTDQIIKAGHVIGFGDVAHVIDKITYDGKSATLTVKPPFRAEIPSGSTLSEDVYFLGFIANANEVTKTYDAAMVGINSPFSVVFAESIT